MNIKKVLFVDDEKYILNSLAKLFKSQNNIRVYTASSCKEAIELLTVNKFDVVVTDYKMPVQDGIFLLNYIKENHGNIVTIMLTGYADTDIVIEALNKDLLYRFMTKPFDIKELIQTVNDALIFSNKKKKTGTENHTKNDEILFNKIFINFDNEKFLSCVSSNLNEHLWLQNITNQLFSEKDRNILIRKILYISRKITEADAGAVFLVNKEDSGNKYFRSVYSHSYQTDKPIIKRNSILREEEIIYDLNSPEKETSLNKEIRSIITENYITQKTLLVPMKNSNNENTGFLILLNTNNAEEKNSRNYCNLYEIMKIIANLSSIAIENLNRHYMNEILLEDFIKTTASVMESRTQDNAGHSFRTAFFCRDIAAAINKDNEIFSDVFISDDEVKILEYSALMQNFGVFYTEKKRDKQEILLYSYNFLKKLPWPDHFRTIPDVFLRFRERLDGSGYPARLKGDAIPLLSRILGFSEEFDSLISGSAYNNHFPMTRDKALDEMSAFDGNNNSAFDQDIIKLFKNKKLYEKYL